MLAAGCSDSGGPAAPLIPAAVDTLLSAERVRSLSAVEQASWLAYLETSAAQRSIDLQHVQAEVALAGRTSWWPAPAGADFRLTETMTTGWFATPAAHQLADVVVSFQTPSGGWSKAVGYSRARESGQSYSSAHTWSWIATFDNGATTEQLRLLGGVVTAQSDSVHRAAFGRGLRYIERAQFPNGCWPQTYPLEGSYHDAATYNDQVAVRILRLLADVSNGAYPFLDGGDRQRAATALDRALACVLASQVVVGRTRTVWGQQHDPLTLAPVPGRAYEPAALCSLESAGLIDYLLTVPAPSGGLTAAVHAAAAWLKERAIYGYFYDPRGSLIASPGAGPLWARFYQIGTNRPVFSDRDGVIRYDLRQVSEERRSGYAWYVAAPAATLARYDIWKRTHPAVWTDTHQQ